MLEAVKARQTEHIQIKPDAAHYEHQHRLPYLFEEDKALNRLDEDAEALCHQRDNVNEGADDVGAFPAVRKPLWMSWLIGQLVGNVGDNVASKVKEVVESVGCQC